MRKHLFAICVSLILAFSCVSYSDEWEAPHPAIFAAEDGSIAIKVQPGRISDKKPSARAALFRLNRDGSEQILKQFRLVNIPVRVLVPETQVNYFVTLDKWSSVGYEHTLVIYNSNGKVVHSLRLEDLLTEKEILDHVKQTESSRWWREGASFNFEIPTTEHSKEDKSGKVIYVDSYPEQARLNILFPWGKKISIRLSTGKVLP